MCRLRACLCTLSVVYQQRSSESIPNKRAMHLNDEKNKLNLKINQLVKNIAGDDISTAHFLARRHVPQCKFIYVKDV
jgi:hypothetical protein